MTDMAPIALLAFLLAPCAGAAMQSSYEKSPIQPVRVTSVDNVDLARGKKSGWFGIHKFGENPSVAAGTTEDIWATGGLISFSSQPVRIRINGGNAADDPLGAGAATVTVRGLDQNWNLYTAPLLSSGAANGPLSDAATHFMRVYRAFVATTGATASYSTPASNVGNLAIATSSNNVMTTILAGAGQTQSTLYTVPRGYTCYLTDLTATVSASKPADVTLYRRPAAWDTTAPFAGAKRILWGGGEIQGFVPQKFGVPMRIDEMTDIWGTATAAAGAAAAVALDYDLACRSNSNND